MLAFHPYITRLEIKNKNKISIIAITETWLNSSINDEEVCIDGYCILRRDRAFGQGGGVCLYIRSDIAFNLREDLILENIESLWIDVLLPRTRPITLGAFYRPPKDHIFIESLSDTFDKLTKDDEVIVLGDM